MRLVNDSYDACSAESSGWGNREETRTRINSPKAIIGKMKFYLAMIIQEEGLSTNNHKRLEKKRKKTRTRE